MHEVISDPAGAGARRKFAWRHLRQIETAFFQQILWHNDDFVPRQRWTDDRVRAGYVIGETIAGQQFDATASLLEMRNSIGLKQYFDVGMLGRFCLRNRMRKPMLARLDLAEFQLRNGRVVDPSFKRGGLQRINVKLAAKLRQCIGPTLDLLLRRQSGGAK